MIRVIALLLSVVGGLSAGNRTADARNHHAHHRFANCEHATAALGHRDSEIDLRVSCWAPREGGDFGFSVIRLDPEKENAAVGARHFNRHPTLTGSGVSRSHGRCSRSRESIGCQAESRGPIEIHETIQVSPNTRCSHVVSITTGVTTCEPTVKRPCPASLLVAELYDDLPHSC